MKSTAGAYRNRLPGGLLLKRFVLLFGLACSACQNKVESKVRPLLIDPESAQFSEVTNDRDASCGLVNSKNRLGGYTGAKIFIIRDGNVTFEDDVDFASALKGAPCSTEAMSIYLNRSYRELRAQNDRSMGT